MGHEIEETDTIMSFRELPWHGIGVVVDEAPTSEEAIVLAGLDWEIQLLPVMGRLMMMEKGGVEVPHYVEVEGAFTPYRIRDGRTYGTVGSKFTIVQNKEAFSFLDNLVSEGDLKFETAGSMRNGAHVFMTAKLPSGCKVAGEEMDIYIVLSNFHDGTGALRIDITFVRVVCKNTQNMAFDNAVQSWRMRHTGSIHGQLEDARKVLQLTRNYEEEFVRVMEAMALESIGREATIVALNKVWSPRDGQEVSETTAGVLANLELSPTIPDEMRTTQYGVFNAATEFLDWKKDYRVNTKLNAHEQRFGRIDKNQGVKQDLLEVLVGGKV